MKFYAFGLVLLLLAATIIMPNLAHALSVTNYTGYTQGGYNGGHFFQSPFPINAVYSYGTSLSETYNGMILSVNLTQGNSTGYDLGFYSNVGSLGPLAENGVSITGQNFEMNLWIDPNSWTWSNGNFIDLGTTDGAYGLGSGSMNGPLTVNSATQFYITSASTNSPLVSQVGNTLSVAQIESDLGSSGASTPVALWIGVGPLSSAGTDNAIVNTCTPISGAMIDALPVTAAVVAQSGEIISNAINANGCGVGVYVGPGVSGVTISAVITNATLAGVYVDHSSATVTNSAISNIGDNPFDGMQYGIGVLYNDSTGNVIKNDISAYQKAGIRIVGSEASVYVANNTVTGLGVVPYIAQNGVELLYGASGSIYGNKISGNSYNGPAACPDESYFASNCYLSGGILLFNPAPSITIQNNEVFQNDIGIWPYSNITDTTVNSLSNNVHNNYGYGVVYDGVGGTVSNTIISNSPIGILATPEVSNTVVTVNALSFSNVTNDYQTAPNIPTNSYSTSILFGTPQLAMLVNANVINDEDSGSVGYWAMDNFTRVINVWQTGAFNYTINFTDFGTSSIPANALSPGKGVLEPFSGNAVMNGEQSWNVVGTFNSLASPSSPDNGFVVPSSLTINASITPSGPYSAFGTTADLLHKTYSNQTGGQGSVSNSLAFVNSYFSNIINEEQPGFNYTYTYNSPLGVQKYVDTSNTAISPRDIVTAQQIINVTMPVTNLPDVGQNGYWALDNLTVGMKVFQTGSNSFVANFSYNGIAYTFAGLRSPGAFNAIEPSNGVVPFVGAASMTFNGVFSPTANTVGQLNSFNDNGVFTGISIDASNSMSVSEQYLRPIEMYFESNSLSFGGNTGASNWYLGLGPWNFTYTYSAPVKNEQWTNANTGSNGDILTGFTINPYVNAFLWFGYNTYGSNVPFGTWSGCPYSPGNTIVTVFCTSTALSSMSWDVNTQNYLTSSTATFVYNGTTIVEHFGSLNTPSPLIANTITFTNKGNGVWTANPANNKLIEYNSITSLPYGFVLWGGNLTFSGMPSQANLTNGTLYEWAYIYQGHYLNNTPTYPDAFYVPSENAYLALTSVVSLSSSAQTGPQIESLVNSTPYLGPSLGAFATLVGSTANVVVTLPSNTPMSVNYTPAGAVLSIKSNGGNTITANVLIANLTTSTSSTPRSPSTSFTKLLVLNVSVSTNTNAPTNSINYALTVAYPCGSNAAPYKLNATTGAWTALSYSRNTTAAPASCTISFTIPPDPIVGLFSSSPAPTGPLNGGTIVVPTTISTTVATTIPTTITTVPTTTILTTVTTTVPTTTIPTTVTTTVPPTTSIPATPVAAPPAANNKLIIAIVVVIAVIVIIVALAARKRAPGKSRNGK